MKRFVFAAATLAVVAPAFAGGRLDMFVLTDAATLPGLRDVDVVPLFWDERCSNVSYTLDDVPANRGRPNEIPTTVLRQELQASFDQWNQIPTSYISMNITNIRAVNNGVPTGNGVLDFINELTFNANLPPGVLASSPSFGLPGDFDFETGDDLDDDGDGDIFDPAAAGRNTCFDIDNDGDIEFPAGFYKAGTIIDNDVQFGSAIMWGTEPSATVVADIRAVATHEFGHSHGLAHSFLNQISATDGTSATMFPFIDGSDEFSERAQRDLHIDDIAWSSLIYPEGSSTQGPAALQAGDRPFRSQFGVLKGSITRNGFGVLGASISATERSTGETLVQAYSGEARAFFNPTTRMLSFPNPATSAVSAVVSGDYELPVPPGLYDLAIEALDGSPAAANNISNTAIIGAMLGQNTFAEEFRGIGRLEDDRELLPALSVPAISLPFVTLTGIDVVTNRDVLLRHAGTATAVSAMALNTTDVIYAERFTNAELMAQIDAGATVTTALFETLVSDASVVPKFKRAGVFFGRVNADASATVDFQRPLFAQPDFVGQDVDLAPLYLPLPSLQTLQLKQKLRSDPTLDVFMVLEAPNEFETGSSGFPPLLRGQAPAPMGPAAGRSFLSRAGGPLTPINLNWSMELRLTPARQ